MLYNTFSIVACDLDEQAWGVAVASKFLAVGSAVSWAKAEVGAVATQAYTKIGFGPEGLALLSEGKMASEVLEILLAKDIGMATRQVAIVDARGGIAAHTGNQCHDWAGHKIGQNFSCQGNILTGPETLDAMATSFSSTSGELADRLVGALAAGDVTGGDRRGKQSAAVLVVRPQGGYGGDTDRYLDLRVDDDPEPVRKLRELVSIHHIFFGETRPGDLEKIDEVMAGKLQMLLKQEGYYSGELHGRWDDASKQAFWALVCNENLEERWNVDRQPEMIDLVVLNYLQRRYGYAN